MVADSRRPVVQILEEGGSHEDVVESHESTIVEEFGATLAVIANMGGLFMVIAPYRTSRRFSR